MKIEEEIQQPKFKNAYQKVAINLIYTANWLQGKQQDFFQAIRHYIITIQHSSYPARTASKQDLRSRNQIQDAG